MRTVLGLDRIREYDSLFKGKRIGLITNYSGIDSQWDLNIDLFLKNGYQIVKIFAPEHGLFGTEAGQSVGDTVCPGNGIPVISLFGENNKQRPSEEELEDVDLLVYDIQDVGLRYYTYIYTMTYCMEAAAAKEIPFVVLDRPNPLGNRIVAGGTLEAGYSSFIGDYGLPLRYGMTLGELGYYFMEYCNLCMEYHVIELKNYTRDMMFPQTGQPWNVPSPALPDFACTVCYSGGCMIGAANISEGRGTPHPFLTYGAPYIDMDEVYDAMMPYIDQEQLLIRKKAFIPADKKYGGKVCYGVEIMPLKEKLDFIPLSVRFLKIVSDLYPEKFALLKGQGDKNHISFVSGSADMEKVLAGKMQIEELLDKWEKQSKDFGERTEKYRIYH